MIAREGAVVNFLDVLSGKFSEKTAQKSGFAAKRWRAGSRAAYIMKHLRYLRGAAALTLGAAASKIVGAFYRVALTSLLGGAGMGLYQLAWPFFALFLTLTSAGASSSVSRLVARERALGGSGSNVFLAGVRLFALLGGAGALLLALFSRRIAALQGAETAAGYLLLAPAVLLGGVLSAFRGYFLGLRRMAPAALSEVLETLVKCGLGIFFALAFRGDAARAAIYALFAVALSEGAALAFLALSLRGERRVPDLKRRSSADILPFVLPVMAAACILPLSQAVDSVLLPRLMGGGAGAVTSFGLLSGGALSLAALPASAARGFASAAIPSVAALSARGEQKGAQRRALYALGATLLLALPAALLLFFFAEKVVSLLYPALSSGEKELLVSLTRLTSFSALTIAGTDTLAASLAGLGRANKAASSMLLAILAKAALQVILVPKMGAAGGAIAANVCFLIAFSLDLFYTVRITNKRKRQYGNDYRSGNKRGGALPSRRKPLKGGAVHPRARRIAPLG